MDEIVRGDTKLMLFSVLLSCGTVLFDNIYLGKRVAGERLRQFFIFIGGECIFKTISGDQSPNSLHFHLLPKSLLLEK